MALSSVSNPTSSASATTTTSSSGLSSSAVSAAISSKGMGEMDFLKLLTTQLQQQDPTNPMDNTQFVSQMAQFSSLQETQQLNQNFTTFNKSMSDALDLQTLAQSSALIGKVVFAGATATDATMGQVTEIRQQAGKIQAVVQLPDGKTQSFSLDQIQQVGATPAQEASFLAPTTSTSASTTPASSTSTST